MQNSNAEGAFLQIIDDFTLHGMLMRHRSSHCSCLSDRGALADTRRIDHEIKGSSIYAFVSLHSGHDFSDAIKKELVQSVRQQIGAFAVPDVIHWAPGELLSLSGQEKFSRLGGSN